MLALLPRQCARGAVGFHLVEMLFVIIRDDVVSMLEVVFDSKIALEHCFGELGFGMLVLGVFHINAVGAPATFYSRIHITAAYSVLGLFPVALALMFSSIKNDPRWRALFPYTVGAAVFALIVAVGRLFLPAGFSWFGLYERVMVLNAISWLEVFAIGLLRMSFLRQRVATQRQSILLEEVYTITGNISMITSEPISSQLK